MASFCQAVKHSGARCTAIAKATFGFRYCGIHRHFYGSEELLKAQEEKTTLLTKVNDIIDKVDAKIDKVDSKIGKVDAKIDKVDTHQRQLEKQGLREFKFLHQRIDQTDKIVEDVKVHVEQCSNTLSAIFEMGKHIMQSFRKLLTGAIDEHKELSTVNSRGGDGQSLALKDPRRNLTTIGQYDGESLSTIGAHRRSEIYMLYNRQKRHARVEAMREGHRLLQIAAE